MKRPSVESILEPLKPFQRKTVDHAFHRLFEAEDSTARFLVADEVGLGKTLVARGIVAKAVDAMWEDVGRIDIVYICSNQSIARSNLPKLQFMGGDQAAFSRATRLTMLATELAPREGQKGLSDSKINFVSFTPGTSFDMGSSSGQRDERRILYHMLQPLFGSGTALMNFFQCGVKDRDKWRDQLRRNPLPIDEGVWDSFTQELEADAQLMDEIQYALENHFHYYCPKYLAESRELRNRLVGRLRQMLANVCVQALEPDLLILDEFQRFKNLLEERDSEQDPAAQIAQALFRAETPEGHPVRTLLLSATPYKLYTSDAEIDEEDHYQDFIETTAFLFGHDPDRVARLKRELSDFAGALKKASAGDPSAVIAAKQAVEDTLTSVMARTERVAATQDKDGMLVDQTVEPRVEAGDIRQYLASDALFRAVGERDPMSYWKSAPYLAHFMHGHSYKVNDRITETLERSPGKVAEVLEQHRDSFLNRADLYQWSGIDPGHAKLRELVHEFLDTGLWQLLWMPPTVPYWPLEDAYENQADRSKALLFSGWNMVPDAVSAVLSYEAERRMLGGRIRNYQDLDTQQSRLLELSEDREGKRSRHRLLLLLLPCLTLADEAHPLSAPAGADRREWVREKVAQLLAHPDLPDPEHGPVDHRWEWAAPLLLDPGMTAFLESWRQADDETKPQPEALSRYIDDFLGLDPATLGRRPEGLVDLVTDMALGAPGVLAARTLGVREASPLARREEAARLAYAFWKLFNRPTVIRLLLQLAENRDGTENTDGAYWHEVMRYCRAGNLQALLDETWHLVAEQNDWVEGQSEEDILSQCVGRITEMVEVRRSRVMARCYKATGNQVEREDINIRTGFALRLGRLTGENGKDAITQDAVRTAFNSPFRPFILASTSVGQEGLDFHPWCHRLIHWNLPGNPVDMEQREGRIHRYKGYAIRKNVAARYARDGLASWTPGKNLWDILFSIADDKARAHDEHDLIPFWLFPGEHKIERHVPTLPYSTEVEAFARLRRQLAAYRVVFGQSHQEDLLHLLDQADVQREDLEAWSIDLSPGQ